MTITLITGANNGIGFETARQLNGLGHTVYSGARSVERREQAAAALGARFVQLDVTDDVSVAAAITMTGTAGRRLDVLVNNAGIAPATAFGPDALKVFDTNTTGVIRVTQAALPLLRTSEHPVVVNVTSSLGSFWAVTNPERQESHFSAGAYGASKAAVPVLTVQDAKAEPAIKFNAVEPGHTATAFTAASGGGRPVAESAKVVVRLATIGADGPTGTLQEGSGALRW